MICFEFVFCWLNNLAIKSSFFSHLSFHLWSSNCTFLLAVTRTTIICLSHFLGISWMYFLIATHIASKSNKYFLNDAIAFIEIPITTILSCALLPRDEDWKEGGERITSIGLDCIREAPTKLPNCQLIIPDHNSIAQTVHHLPPNYLESIFKSVMMSWRNFMGPVFTSSRKSFWNLA